MNVKAIPSGYSSVTPYLIVEGATEAIDPFGHVCNVATHVEDLSPEEMEKRMAELS